jgi:carboxymethylenebutenolidase
MCDEATEHDLDAAGALSRRDVGLIVGSLGLASTFPANAAALPVVEKDVLVTTPDGQADCWFAAPAKGKHPAVIVWPDIFGLRPAFKQMYLRLAEAGYAVLIVNPFYRSAKAPTSVPGVAFDDAFRAQVGKMRTLMTPEAIARDALAFASFLDAQKSVNVRRKIGVTGYCMGGSLAVRTAAGVPARIGAAASFHGGILATANPDSPHLLIPKTKASFLIAVADNDDKQNPDDKVKLRAAFDAAKRPAEIEVYAGAMHGWCPPDGRAYNQALAEKAWGRMLVLFGKTLG